MEATALANKEVVEHYPLDSKGHGVQQDVELATTPVDIERIESVYR